MEYQPLQYKLPLQPTRRQKARSGFVGRSRNPFGPLPGKQTQLGDFFSNMGIRDELPVEEEGKFTS
jgi:hypothetical protein